MDRHFLLSAEASPEQRIFRDLGKLQEVVASCRTLGMRIVLTSGSWDLTHIGHFRYLAQAKSHGDILIVGVDSDAKVRERKGPNRPIVQEDERMEVLCHSRAVDLVFLKQPEQERWTLIKAVRPDTLIMVNEGENETTMAELRQFCGQVVMLDPQATTSTTARIRKTIVDSLGDIKDRLRAVVQDIERLSGDGGAG